MMSVPGISDSAPGLRFGRLGIFAFALAFALAAAVLPAAAVPLDVTVPTDFPSLKYGEIARQESDTAFDTAAQSISRKKAEQSIREFQSKMRKAHRILERIIAVPDAKRTYLNTFDAFDDFYNSMEEAVNWPGFYAYVHPDPFIRAAGEEIDKFASKYLVDVGSSRSIYLAFKALSDLAHPLSAEERYLLDETLKDFEDGGVALPDTARAKYKDISKQISDLAIEFSANLRNYRDTLVVTAAQLAGMDSDYIARLGRRSDTLYILTLDYPIFLPYMDYGKDEKVRKTLLTKFRNRAKTKNPAILEKVIALRRERASLVGRRSHADFAIARRMAQTPERAMSFLSDVRRRVGKKAKIETTEITALKREATGDTRAKFEQWDRMFYSKLLTRRKYDYDPQTVKEYFESSRVTAALLDITQKIYGVTFKKSTARSWHPDVDRYTVYSGGKAIGEIYLDLYPRPNKYTHAAAWGIRPRRVTSGGRIQLPASALVCNFPRPAPGRPSLLSFDEVETFFHEFGHVLHGIFSMTRFAQVSGTRVMRDFVEAPSQMFEKWLHDTQVLAGFARHYRTGEIIPPALVDRIIKSRNVTSGIETQRQLFYGIYDLTLHGREKSADIVKLWFDLKKDVEGMEEIPGTCGPAGFDHLMGYAAGYYGYLWSRMIAADMYETFLARGKSLLDPKEGMRFRREVLSTGGSKHPDDIVRLYLGRPPAIDAFLRDLGIEE